MWKSLSVMGFIYNQVVNKMLTKEDVVIHIIHGIKHSSALSTFYQHELSRYFHKVIHALIVYNEGVGLSDLLDTVNQFIYDSMETVICFLILIDFFIGMDNSSMISSAKELANLGKRGFRQITA